MVIPTEDDRAREVSSSDGLIESKGNVSPGPFICIQDPCLGSDDETMLHGMLDPPQIVLELPFDRIRRIVEMRPKHLCCEFIAPTQILIGP